MRLDSSYIDDAARLADIISEQDAEIERLRKIIRDYVGAGPHYVIHDTSPEWRAMLDAVDRMSEDD